jgi:ATP-dependent helicase/nuclease subunit B
MVLMAVQFILGRSGTGKTSYCIQAIVGALLEPADEQPLILLVPEQATYQAERAILTDIKIAGYNRLRVLSFDRLQFLLSGKNTARPQLSRIGRQMIVHRILRDNKSRLKVFGSSANQPGLGRQMAETIAELHQYAKTPDDIDRLLGELQKNEHNSLAVLKFADIGLIFEEYLKFIEGRFIDPDIELNCARRAVAEAGFVKGAKLWVDGFAGFTTAELAILAELLKVVADAQIALCLDPSSIDLANPDTEKLDPVGLFNPTQRTYADLVERIKKCKLRLAQPVILDEAVRFSSCQQLAHIERNAFKLEVSKMPLADSIHIISAPNGRAEVQFVARQILKLVRENDYRYRDIAVIASDIESYQHYTSAYFDDYGIPFFIDKRKPLNQHAAIELICSALQVVTGGFTSSDIFAYLKTDLVPIERRDVDALENYCLAFGITGDDWQSEKEWDFTGEDNGGFDKERINEIRLETIEPLLELRDRLCPGDKPQKTMSADEFVRTISDFLKTLQVRQTIKDWIKEAEKRKDNATADEHRQFYDKLIDIFDELVEVFAGQELTCEDYVAILDSAFSQLALAFIPPTLDQVLVGSIERSRHPDLKAVFLVGATQRQFPVPVSFDSILSEDDRNAAESADFPLAATASQMLAERQYLAYIAFTRTSQFLYVTYPSTDDKGGAMVRSQYIDHLESLFENLKEQSIAGEQIEIEKVHSKIELADLLCSRLGKDAAGDLLERSHKRLGGLLNGICSDEQLGELGSKVQSTIKYDNCAELDKTIVEKLSAGEIRSSATRLSTFAACPYQYFARYVLELEEREEFKFEPLDVGNFYHRVLDALLKRLNKERKDFATIENSELSTILAEQIEKVIQTNSFISNFKRHSLHNAYIINSAGEVLEDCVLAIAQMVRSGSFRPKQSEVSFGKVKDSVETFGEYEAGLSDGRLLSLDGKIDRLDIAELDDEKIAIVFDYKRKDKTFSWAKLYYGLDMQLPIYMLAVRNASNPQCKVQNVAGAFYMPVEVAPTRATLDELSEKTESFAYKAKGLFNGKFGRELDKTALKDSKFYNFYVTKDGEPYGSYGNRGVLKPADFEKVLKFTERKIVKLAEEILSGVIDVKPYRLSGQSPCSYCRYKSVCRFDWQINDYNFLESLNKLQSLEKMGGA